MKTDLRLNFECQLESKYKFQFEVLSSFAAILLADYNYLPKVSNRNTTPRCEQCSN